MKIRKRRPPSTPGMSSRHSRWRLSVIAGLLSGCFWPAAQAQEAGAAPPPASEAQPGPTRRLPPVRVTATGEPEVPKSSSTGTKTDTPLIETPQSISVVTREQIETQAAATVGQALRYTPGVVAEWRGMSSSKYDHLVVRGSAGYTVDAYWDGLKIPSMGSIGGASPDTYFLERIEVLRGPASVLYGQGAANGLVQLVSKKPSATAARELRLSIGSYGYKQLGLDFTGPVNDDKTVLYRLVGLGFDTDSPVDHVQERRIGIAPSVTWRPGENTSLTVLGSYQRDPDLGYYDVRPVIGTALANPLGKVPMDFFAGEPGVDDSSREYSAIGYELEHRFNARWQFRQNLRYTDADYDFKIVAFAALRPDNRTADRYVSRIVRSGDGLGVDNQLLGHFATGALEHTVLAGLDHQREDFINTTYAGTAAPIDLFNPVYGGAVNLISQPRADADQATRQTGFYLQDQIRYGGWSLLLGGRRDRATSTSTNRRTGAVTEGKDQATTGRVGAVYQFESGLAPYASYAESFQPVSGFDIDGNPFKPARGKQAEIGLKWQPRGADALFTLAAFDLKEDNLSTPDDRNVGFNVQLGEVRTRGVELEGRFPLAPGLNVSTAYTWLDSEITQGVATQVGKSRPNSPKQSASVWADYAFAGELIGLGAGLGVRYVGKSPANATNSFDAPAYTLVDFTLHYDFARMNNAWRGADLALHASNLLDKRYVGSCGGNSIAAGYCWEGYPRMIRATLAYRW